MLKTYKEWHKLKFWINVKHPRPNHFKAGEVWWCTIGENIGYEVDGKNEEYVRLVLIIKKYSDNMFFGVPLTSKQKEPKPYYYIMPQDINLGMILFSQGRSFDAARLVKYKTKLGLQLFNDIKQAYSLYLET